MNFIELCELVRVASPSKVKHLDVIGKNRSPRGQLGVLYSGLLEGKWRTEEEMVAWFEQELGVSRDNLRRLQRKLYRRLANTALFLDANEAAFSDFQRAYYNCYRELAIFKVLLGRGTRQAAIRLGNRLIRRAVRFEFVDIIIIVARELQLYSGTVQNDPKKAHHYGQLVSEYMDVFVSEIKAENYYQEVVNMVRSRAPRSEVVRLAVVYSEALAPLVKRYDSYKLYLYAFNLFLLRHELESNYEQMLEQANQAVAHFQQKKHLVSNTAIFSFLFRMLVAQIQLGKYDEGQRTAERCLELVPEGTPNWFYSLINYIILNLHRGTYAQAKSLLEMALSSPAFRHQDARITEQLKLLEAVLHYLVKIGKLQDAPAPAGHRRKFRLSRFLNDVPVFSKDKRGTNVTILILQILFLLLNRDYEQVVDRLGALRVYAHRYLRKDETYRSNVFIKMLNVLPAARFHKDQAARKAKPLFRRLEEVPLSQSMLGADIEVLPYERLWEFVIDSLSTRRSYVV